MTVSRRTDWLAVALLAVLATLFFADVLFGVNQFYMRDLTRYYYPAKHILREIVRGGEFPYWNPYFSAGQPLAANPEHEVFYPLTWLILLPSYDLGYRLLILLHVYIALAGMYALLRSMELKPPAAFLGALSFGLGGLFLSYINLLPILFCAAWLPLTCVFVRRFLLRRTLRDFALASLFFGLQVLVGEPTTVLQTGLLIGLYGLYRAWYAKPRASKAITRTLWIALISIAALAVGAAQIIPAIDHVHDSSRSRPFDFDLVQAWSMPWAKFGELVFPNILGHISISRVMWYWGGGLYPGMGSPFLFSVYSGLLILAMAVGASFVRPRGGRFVLITCVISAILALGGHTPLLELLYKSGIAQSIRYPEKFALMGIFALIVFGSQMLDRMLDGDEALREGALGFALAATTIAVFIAVIGYTPLYAKTFSRIWGLTAGDAGAKREISLSQTDWILAAIRGGALVGLLWFARTRYRKPWLVALGAFVCLDLGPVVNELNPRMPRRFFDPPPLAATFPPNRNDYRIFHEADWYGQTDVARKYFSTGSAVYWIVRNGLFPMTPAGSDLQTVLERDYDKTELLASVDFTDSMWDVTHARHDFEPFLTMSNIWYRAEYKDFDQEKKRAGDMKNAVAVSYRQEEHHPRFYFADQIVTVTDRADFVKKLTNGSYSRKVAFVSRPSFVPARGEVHAASQTANSITLDVESFGQGFLVMSITPHKYWRAAVDGQVVPSIVTNLGYQGIIVTPGKHRVTMHYHNELITIGLIITIGTLVLLIVAAIVPRRRLMAPTPAYSETVHVVADAAGVHTEPAEEP